MQCELAATVLKACLIDHSASLAQIAFSLMLFGRSSRYVRVSLAPSTAGILQLPRCEDQSETFE